jgi:DnaJ domain
MGYHSFSLDPRTVLGVPPTASLDEIHEAYRLKSKKHHPDLGGDEWAFCMVARAYEVLKTTAGTVPSRPWQSPKTNVSEPESAVSNPNDFRVIEVELIWIRFESDRSARLWSSSEGNEETLSVYSVISWPTPNLVAQAVELGNAGEILRTLIDLFEGLRGSPSVIAGRSRIEDGRFVGWLSYPDVLAAQDALLSVRSKLQGQGLTVNLQTVDERIPSAWQSASQESTLAAAV